MFNNPNLLAQGHQDPFWPDANSAMLSANQFWDRPNNMAAQNYGYYGGYNNYAGGYDPDSNRNCNYNPMMQSPMFQSQMQPQQPVQQQAQPWSAYGGSGNQQTPPAVMPTLGNNLMQMGYQQQQFPAPTFNSPNQPINQVPLYDQYSTFHNPGMIDRKIDACWDNRYVQPQQIPTPRIDFNQPYNPNAMPNPYQQQMMMPSFNNQSAQRSWNETYAANLAAKL